MPYPQYTFAQRAQLTPATQPTRETPPATRPRWSDRIDLAALESTEVATNKYPDGTKTATSCKLIFNKPQKSSQGIPISPISLRSQPPDIPPASHPAEVAEATSRYPPNYTYKCTLCWKENKPPCYTIGPASRVVCLDCWRWIHSVSICWKCNEVVFRKEDAVSFGWCYWHWSCFSCLICSSPLPPPDYVDDHDQPHTKGMALQEPPVCSSCSESPVSIKKLEQHADVLKKPNEPVKSPKHVLESSSGHISLEQPLRKEANFVTEDPLKTLSASRPLPAWMALLPSQKRAEIHPPKHSILQRRSTFPYFETTRMSTSHDSPGRTPPNDMSTMKDDAQIIPLMIPKIGSSHEQSRPRLPSSRIKPQLSFTNLSSFPFVDNHPEESDHHMDYVSEKPLCPSAYAVQPSINFSRPRQPSIAKSAPSVADMPKVVDKEKRARKRLSKRLPVRKAEEINAMPKLSERSRHKSRPWKLDWSRSTSSEENSEKCPKTYHTLEPRQDIEAAKPPFLMELSSFLAGRAGKWILPSRVGESGSHQGS